MIEFPTIPSEATSKKELNDCTAGDLEYLINIRKQMHEITGVEHSDRCQTETRVLRALVNAMKAEGAPRVGDLDQTGTLEGYWPTEDE